MDEEKWKSLAHLDLPSYEISTFGILRNINTGKELKGSDNGGYVIFGLRNSNKEKVSRQAHRLVALTFLPKPDIENLTVDHINRDKKIIMLLILDGQRKVNKYLIKIGKIR